MFKKVEKFSIPNLLIPLPRKWGSWYMVIFPELGANSLMDFSYLILFLQIHPPFEANAPFYNRKGFKSLNVLIVSNADFKIYYCVCFRFIGEVQGDSQSVDKGQRVWQLCIPRRQLNM